MHSLVLASVLLAPGVATQGAIEADVVIRGATLVDGTGKPGVVGDLGRDPVGGRQGGGRKSDRPSPEDR